MTVTNMPERGDEGALSALAGRILAEVREAARKPDLSAVYEAIKSAGIRNARRALAEAPGIIAEAQAAFREAQAVEAMAREAYVQATSEAEWVLSGQVHTDGNKRYRWEPCDDTDPACPVCAGAGRYRVFMLADEVTKWKAAEARNVPAVQAAERVLRDSEEATAAARDAIAISERKFSACKLEVTASVAELNILAVGLSSKENSR